MLTEIDKFTQWAQAHHGSPTFLDRQTMETLKEEKPFFYRIFTERREAWAQHFRMRRLHRQRAKIERADRRYSNRSRRVTQSYLFTQRACDRLGSNESYNLRIMERKNYVSPFKGKVMLSDAELLAALEADLAALNEELADRGEDPATFHGAMRRDCLSWKWEVSEMEDTDGEKHDMGTYEVYLTTRGNIYVFGGDHEHNGYYHPHVHSDGSLCTGDFQNFRDLVCMSGSLLTAFQTINGILETFNAESPYIKLSELVYGHDEDDEDDDSIQCHGCGEWCDREDSYYVHDEDYCPDCVWTCDKCYEQFVVDDDEQIIVGGTSYCPDCAAKHLVKCYECEEWLLEDKATWAWCDDEERDVPVCEDCCASCEDCEKLVVLGDIHNREGCSYCTECHDELQTSCHLCGHIIYKDEGNEFTATDGEERYVCNSCHEKLEELGILPGAEKAEEAASEPEPEPVAVSADPPNLQPTPEAVRELLDMRRQLTASQVFLGGIGLLSEGGPVSITIDPVQSGRFQSDESNLSAMPAELARD